MKKRIFNLILLFVLVLSASARQPKYIFYFIGDGMGTSHVNAAETYLAALEGRIGTSPLCFASFPQSAYVTTYSATNGVTDSAAAGTALATGKKTYNGAIGVDKDTLAVHSVAYKAHQAGAAVGIGTSVTVDHATPSAFYAHQRYRQMTPEIAQDLIKANFEFYAGSDFSDRKKKNDEGFNIYEQVQQYGYTLARGFEDYKKHKRDAKMILLQPENASKRDASSLPFAIDSTPYDLTLTQITRAAIDFLLAKTQSKKSKNNGFFLMIEGGKIDFAAHTNDAATCIREILDFDAAIKVAYQFYEKHPDETLIVVTADHETGGLVLGRAHYQQHLEVLQYQKMSAERYSGHLTELRQKLGGNYDWESVKADLTENWGFWDKVNIDEKQEKRLKKVFEDIQKGMAEDSRSLYITENALAATAKTILNECAYIGWGLGTHTNSYVPLFAIGAGAEAFHGRMDNIEIPAKIANIAGY